MRVILADVQSDRGFVNKDTVVGGYGSRLEPFSRVTRIISALKQQFHDVPSVHMAYAAAILSRAGHAVVWPRVAAGRGRIPAARESRVPRVLHLLSAPDSGRLSRTIDSEHRRRDRAALRPVRAAVRHLPRSAVLRTARSMSRAVRRNSGTRPHL